MSLRTSKEEYSYLALQLQRWIKSGSRKIYQLSTRSKYTNPRSNQSFCITAVQQIFRLTKQELEEIDRAHRSQLRNVW